MTKGVRGAKRPGAGGLGLGWLLLAACGAGCGGGGGPGPDQNLAILSVTAQPSALTPGETAVLTCEVNNPNGVALAYVWTPEHGEGIFPAGAAAAQVSWQAPAARGLYRIAVSVAGGGRRLVGLLEVDVREDAPVLAVDPEVLHFGSGGSTGEERAPAVGAGRAPAGVASAASLELEVRNVGRGTLNWTIASDSSWVSLSPSSGSATTAPATVTIDVDRSGMPGGYTGTMLTVSSNGGELRVPVAVWTLPEAALGVDPVVLDFGTSTTPRTFTIANAGTQDLAWQARAAAAAGDSIPMTIAPSSGVLGAGGNAAAQVSVNTAGLPSGVHVAAIIVESDGGAASVAVRAVRP